MDQNRYNPAPYDEVMNYLDANSIALTDEQTTQVVQKYEAMAVVYSDHMDGSALAQVIGGDITHPIIGKKKRTKRECTICHKPVFYEGTVFEDHCITRHKGKNTLLIKNVQLIVCN